MHGVPLWVCGGVALMGSAGEAKRLVNSVTYKRLDDAEQLAKHRPYAAYVVCVT